MLTLSMIQKNNKEYSLTWKFGFLPKILSANFAGIGHVGCIGQGISTSCRASVTQGNQKILIIIPYYHHYTNSHMYCWKLIFWLSLQSLSSIDIMKFHSHLRTIIASYTNMTLRKVRKPSVVSTVDWKLKMRTAERNKIDGNWWTTCNLWFIQSKTPKIHVLSI